MSTNKFEQRCVAYYQGDLSEEEKNALLAEAASSPSLSAEFGRYDRMFSLLKAAAGEQFRAPASLQVKVMDEVSLRPKLSSWRFSMFKGMKFSSTFFPLATAISACVLLLLLTHSFLGQESAQTFSMIGVNSSSGSGYSAPERTGLFRRFFSRKPAQAPSAGVSQLNTQMERAPLVLKSQPNAASGAPITPHDSLGPPAPQMEKFSFSRQDGVLYESGPSDERRSAQKPGTDRQGAFNDSESPLKYRGEPSTEIYGQHEENPLVSAASQPLSTFSLDVDTGSYTNARRFIRNGQLPPPESVRIEEFINYFNYEYPVQDEKGPFTFNYEIAPSPLEPGKHLLRLGLRTIDRSRPDDAGWNLVFLVDVSGSMADENKLPLIKTCIKVLAANMRPVDRLGIVTYAGSAGIALPSTYGDNKSAIFAAVDRLSAGGSTNGSGGITAAYDLAARNFVRNGVNRVILATDGDFNVGITSFSSLLDLVEQKRTTGISLTTIGVGAGNYNERNLEQLADKGNGNYFYVDSAEEGKRVLGEHLAANMQTVAKDVKLQVEFNPAVVKAYRLVGYDNRKLAHQDFANDAVDAGEVGAGHTVTALYELILTDSPLAAGTEQPLRYRAQGGMVNAVRTDELANMKIRYKQPDADASIPLEFPIHSEHKIADARGASRDFRFAAAVSYFGHVLRRSRFAGSYSMSEIQELAEGALGDDIYGQRREFTTLVESAQSIIQRRGINARH